MVQYRLFSSRRCFRQRIQQVHWGHNPKVDQHARWLCSYFPLVFFLCTMIVNPAPHKWHQREVRVGYPSRAAVGTLVWLVFPFTGVFYRQFPLQRLSPNKIQKGQRGHKSKSWPTCKVAVFMDWRLSSVEFPLKTSWKPRMGPNAVSCPHLLKFGCPQSGIPTWRSSISQIWLSPRPISSSSSLKKKKEKKNREILNIEGVSIEFTLQSHCKRKEKSGSKRKRRCANVHL